MSGYSYSQETTPSEEDEFDFDQPFETQTYSNVQPQPSYQQFPGQQLSPSLGQGQMYNRPVQSYQQPQQYMQLQHFQQPQQYPGYQQSAQYQTQQPQLYHSQQSPQYHQQEYLYSTTTPATSFVTPIVPSNYPYDTQTVTPFPPYSEPVTLTPRMSAAGPSSSSAGYLSPDEASRPRGSRTISFASDRSSVHSQTYSDVSTRSVSPALSEMQRWGYQNDDGTWYVVFFGSTSRSLCLFA